MTETETIQTETQIEAGERAIDALKSVAEFTANVTRHRPGRVDELIEALRGDGKHISEAINDRFAVCVEIQDRFGFGTTTVDLVPELMQLMDYLLAALTSFRDA